MHPLPHSSNSVRKNSSHPHKIQLLPSALQPPLSFSSSVSHQVLVPFASEIFSLSPVLFPSKPSTNGYQAELCKPMSDRTLLGLHSGNDKLKANLPNLAFAATWDGAPACPLTPVPPHLQQHLAVSCPLPSTARKPLLPAPQPRFHHNRLGWLMPSLNSDT